MVYVRARLAEQSQAHMVLALRQAQCRTRILDNLRPGAAGLAPADLTPVFSFNTDGLWRGVGRSRKATRWPGSRCGVTSSPKCVPGLFLMEEIMSRRCDR